MWPLMSGTYFIRINSLIWSGVSYLSNCIMTRVDEFQEDETIE